MALLLALKCLTYMSHQTTRRFSPRTLLGMRVTLRACMCRKLKSNSNNHGLKFVCLPTVNHCKITDEIAKKVDQLIDSIVNIAIRTRVVDERHKCKADYKQITNVVTLLQIVTKICPNQLIRLYHIWSHLVLYLF